VPADGCLLLATLTMHWGGGRPCPRALLDRSGCAVPHPTNTIDDLTLALRILFVVVTGYGDAGVRAGSDLRRLVEWNFEPFEASKP
jgi:hypothetical protein